jgi:hypothetical protein
LAWMSVITATRCMTQAYASSIDSC